MIELLIVLCCCEIAIGQGLRSANSTEGFLNSNIAPNSNKTRSDQYHEQFDPDHRPNYDLKLREDIPAEFVSLDKVFRLVLLWGADMWRDDSGDETPVGESHQCLSDSSLCLHFTALRSIPRRVEMWLILEAFLANLDAHPGETAQWITQAYSYARRNVRPQPLIATVKWGPPGQSMNTGQGITELDTMQNRTISVIETLETSNTTSNLTEYQRKGVSDMVVRITWYENPAMTLSGLSWHLITFLKDVIWANNRTLTMKASGWNSESSYVGPQHGLSILQFDPSLTQLLTWEMLEEALTKLWTQVGGNVRGTFKSNMGIRDGRSVRFFAYLYFKAVGPADVVRVS